METKKIDINIHRVELIKFRDGKQKPKEITTFSDEHQAKINFKKFARIEFNHLVTFWAFSSTTVYSSINLYINDKLDSTIILTAGVI